MREMPMKLYRIKFTFASSLRFFSSCDKAFLSIAGNDFQRRRNRRKIVPGKMDISSTRIPRNATNSSTASTELLKLCLVHLGWFTTTWIWTAFGRWTRNGEFLHFSGTLNVFWGTFWRRNGKNTRLEVKGISMHSENLKKLNSFNKRKDIWIFLWGSSEVWSYKSYYNF